MVGSLLDCCGAEALSSRRAGCDPLWRAGDRQDPSSEGRGQPDLGHIPAGGRLRAHPEVPWRRPQAGAGAAPAPGSCRAALPPSVVWRKGSAHSVTEASKSPPGRSLPADQRARGCGQVRELFRVADDLSPTIVFIGATSGMPPRHHCACRSDCRAGCPCCLPILTHGELCVQTRSMPSVPSGTRLPAGGSARSSAPCWNCSISWMASTAWATSRCSLTFIGVCATSCVLHVLRNSHLSSTCLFEQAHSPSRCRMHVSVAASCSNFGTPHYVVFLRGDDRSLSIVF